MVNCSMMNPLGLSSETPRILERTGGDKASLGHVALTDDQLPGICTRLVGIGGKVAHHAVHVYHLVDVARNQPVVISLLGKVHIVVIGALVRQLQGTAYIVLDRVLLRGEREEQLVKSAGRVPAPRRGGSVKDPARGRASATCPYPAHRSFPVASRRNGTNSTTHSR